MSENYDMVIDKVDKYYYLIVSTTKVVLLSSSDDLKEAKELAVKKLEPHIDKFIGKKLLLIKLVNTYDKFKKDKKGLGLIAGPICFEVMGGTIDNKKKITSERETGNNKYYLSKKYIKKNIDNISKDVKKVAKKYTHNLFNQSIMKINIM